MDKNNSATRIYYQVRFDGHFHATSNFATLKEAQEYISSANNLGSLEEWYKLGKSEADWHYWRDLYNNHAHIVQIIEIITLL